MIKGWFRIGHTGRKRHYFRDDQKTTSCGKRLEPEIIQLLKDGKIRLFDDNELLSKKCILCDKQLKRFQGLIQNS